MPIDSHFFLQQKQQQRLALLLPTLLEQTQYSRVVFVPSGSVIVQPSTFLNTLLWSPTNYNDSITTTTTTTLHHTMIYPQDQDPHQSQNMQMLLSLSPDGRRISHRTKNNNNNDTETTTTISNNKEGHLTRLWSDNFHMQSLCPSMEIMEVEDGNNIPVVCPWNVRLQDIACHRRHNNESSSSSSIVVQFQTAAASTTTTTTDSDSSSTSRNDANSAFDILRWTAPKGLTKELTSKEQRHCRLSIAQRIRRLYFLALQRAQLPPLSATELLRYTKDHHEQATSRTTATSS
jgi:hypothetical protein